MAKLAHHVRIQGRNRQQCQVVVLALPAKEGCLGVANSASNLRTQVEGITE